MQWKKGMAAALAACFLAGTFPMGALAAEEDPLQAESNTCICETPCGADTMNQLCPVCGAEDAVPETCGAYFYCRERCRGARVI